MSGWRVLFALALCGCLEAGSTVCADGTICPADLTCAPVTGCSSPEQLAACDAVAEGGDCAVDGIPGSCMGGVCVFFICGDGVTSGNEQCDPLANGTTTCLERGFYQGGEIGCGGDCSWDTSTCSEFCGDGMLQAPQELCETDIDPVGTCTSFGFDAGRIGCAGCGANFARCQVIGWSDAPISAGVGLAVSDLATAGDSVVAVGNSTDQDNAPFAARWRGTWSTLGELDDDLYPVSVWATGSDQIWMTGMRGSGGFVASWDGADWQVEDIPSPGTGIWARSADEVFVLSDEGVRQWNGASWSYTELAPTFGGTALWGEPDEGGAVYAGGFPRGIIYRFDGSWEEMEVLPGDQGVLDIIGTPDGGLWAASLYGAVHRWNGSDWIDMEVPVLIDDAIFALDGDGELFLLAGSHGITEQQRYNVLQRRGQSWRDLSQSIELDLLQVVPVAFAGVGHQMFVFGGSLGFRYGGSAWWDVSPPTVNNALSAWARDEEIFVAALNGEVHHRDASGWNPTGVSGYQVDGAGDHVYVLDRTSAEISHSDGEGWTTSKLGAANPIDLAVRGPDDVYVITNGGTLVQHWNGNALSEVGGVDGGSLQRIHCAVGGDCVAVGTAGTFWSSAGLETPTHRTMYAVWVAPNGSVLAGGDFGEIWLHDGASWQLMENALTGVVFAIQGTAEGDVFAAAGQGLIHFDGNDQLAWHPVRILEDSSVGSFAVAGDTVTLIGALPSVVRLERTYPW